MQKYIFIVTLPNGTKTAHSAIQSFLEHPMGVPLSKQQWFKISKDKEYPIQYKGIVVEKIALFSTSQSRVAEFEARVL